jgi:hypothetical protein
MKKHSAEFFGPSGWFPRQGKFSSVSLTRRCTVRQCGVARVVFPALLLLIFSFAVLDGTAVAATEGLANNFFGYGAGAHTTGTGNSFFGGYAGNANTSAYSNSFFGDCAGGLNTTGYENSFFGAGAAYLNTTGHKNSFFGSDAGYANTTGNGNSFFGSAAGNANTNGFSNSFFGSVAAYSNTTGYQNSFFGYAAGYANTTGTSNSFFGYHTGYLNKTGHGNVFLGYRAGYNETGSNKLYISNSATSTPLIYGDFSTGTVVVNGKITLQSSREYKDDIEALGRQEAFDALEGLTPMKFVYKADRTEKHVGFIAEDVPELVSTKDRKGINPMDIVTVLTKVVQEQQKIVEQQQGIISAHAEKIAKLERLLLSKGD